VSRLAHDKQRSELAEYERLQRSESRLKPKIIIDLKKVCVLSNEH